MNEREPYVVSHRVDGAVALVLGVGFYLGGVVLHFHDVMSLAGIAYMTTFIMMGFAGIHVAGVLEGRGEP